MPHKPTVPVKIPKTQYYAENSIALTIAMMDKINEILTYLSTQKEEIFGHDIDLIGKKMEGIEIVTSDRIDYCCQCKKEHGYDCPKDTPSPHEKGWEKEFDEKFVRSDGLMDKYQNEWDEESIQTTAEAIKDFIKNLLTTERERVREGIRNLDNDQYYEKQDILYFLDHREG